MDTNSGTRREDPPVPEYEQHVQDLDGDKVNIVTEQNDPVTRAEALDPPCTHDVQVNGMCALCGNDLSTRFGHAIFMHVARSCLLIEEQQSNLYRALRHQCLFLSPFL